ncbi:MAG TPA: ubiquitin-like domain-containing protein, partial [Candidatus Saccharibacteria bacterium]|nr:ubiquitin-like domain-containing protein [Candidatus Saccharibacteria bacterium]
MKLQKKSIHLIFSRRVITACVFAFFVIAGSLYATRVFAADTTLSQDERLVTIHDGSSEVTIVTRAATVKDALSQASIAVSPVDIVEPAASEQLVAKSYQVN